MRRYWISWNAFENMGSFELHSPWWESGYFDGGSTICAALLADSEDDAKARIVASYDSPPVNIEWRFCREREPDWSPFCDRFERASWMVWP